jgi:putative DNA primase/helicase
MMHLDLRTIARALGGDVCGRQVLAPGPGHSAKDRSLSVRPSPSAPEGFLALSHAGDDWRLCRDYVRERCGFGKFEPSRRRDTPETTRGRDVMSKDRTGADDDAAKIARARRLWSEGVDPRGTLAERYLASRLLGLDDDIAGPVLRFYGAAPWRAVDAIVRVPAMLALYRDIRSDEICGVQVTRLSADGAKVGRKMRGRCGIGAIKFDADAHVTTGLTIGEGAETVMAARQLRFRPAWALGSIGAIASFDVLTGIEHITILEENDTNGASARGVTKCAERWHAAGREVVLVASLTGNDVNDAVRGAA